MHIFLFYFRQHSPESKGKERQSSKALIPFPEFKTTVSTGLVLRLHNSLRHKVKSSLVRSFLPKSFSRSEQTRRICNFG